MRNITSFSRGVHHRASKLNQSFKSATINTSFPPPPYSLLCESPTSSSFTNNTIYSSPPPAIASSICTSADQVRRELLKLHAGEAVGPDGVGPWPLTAARLQPEPKTAEGRGRHPALDQSQRHHDDEPKDHRPVVLTSQLMKTLKGLVLSRSGPWSSHFWASPACIIFLLKCVCTRLIKAGAP